MSETSLKIMRAKEKKWLRPSSHSRWMISIISRKKNGFSANEIKSASEYARFVLKNRGFHMIIYEFSNFHYSINRIFSQSLSLKTQFSMIFWHKISVRYVTTFFSVSQITLIFRGRGSPLKNDIRVAKNSIRVFL